MVLSCPDSVVVWSILDASVVDSVETVLVLVGGTVADVTLIGSVKVVGVNAVASVVDSEGKLFNCYCQF